MKNFLAKFPLKKVSVFVTIVVSFTYNVLLDRDVSCTCKPGDSDCDIYMALPFFIIFLLILYTDKKFFWSCRYTCKCPRGGGQQQNEREEGQQNERDEGQQNEREEGEQNEREEGQQNEREASCCGYCRCGGAASYCRCGGAASYCRCQFCGIFFFRILKAGLVGLLWVVSVLIDGDWYVCRKNDYTAHPQLPCKTNITAEEQVIIAELKNKSRSIGFGVILGILFVAILIQLIHTALPCLKKCCAETCCKETCREETCCKETCRKEKCCDERILFDKLIAEEEEIVLDNFLRSKAKDELRENIKRTFKPGRLKECFHVAEELIDRTGSPGQNSAAADQPTSLRTSTSTFSTTVEENRTAQNPAEPNEPGPSGIWRDDLSIFGTPQERKPLVHP